MAVALRPACHRKLGPSALYDTHRPVPRRVPASTAGLLRISERSWGYQLHRLESRPPTNCQQEPDAPGTCERVHGGGRSSTLLALSDTLLPRQPPTVAAALQPP